MFGADTHGIHPTSNNTTLALPGAPGVAGGNIKLNVPLPRLQDSHTQPASPPPQLSTLLHRPTRKYDVTYCVLSVLLTLLQEQVAQENVEHISIILDTCSNILCYNPQTFNQYVESYLTVVIDITHHPHFSPALRSAYLLIVLFIKHLGSIIRTHLYDLLAVCSILFFRISFFVFIYLSLFYSLLFSALFTAD